MLPGPPARPAWLAQNRDALRALQWGIYPSRLGVAAGGILSAKMGGPGVRPMAPNLGLSIAFGRSNDWTVSEGEDRHRRSVYTEVRRNGPYAGFATFDAPNREVCTIRRGRTNTPLQAFVKTRANPLRSSCLGSKSPRDAGRPGLRYAASRIVMGILGGVTFQAVQLK
jgi:hypothetical protein